MGVETAAAQLLELAAVFFWERQVVVEDELVLLDWAPGEVGVFALPAMDPIIDVVRAEIDDLALGLESPAQRVSLDPLQQVIDRLDRGVAHCWCSSLCNRHGM